jgi:hypothetical protein
MKRAASRDVPPTFEQLKERGDRAMRETREAIDRLRVTVDECTEGVAEANRYALQLQKDVPDTVLESKLLGEVHTARRVYRVATQEYNRIREIAKAADGKGDVDGSQAIYCAGIAEREALEQYAQSLDTFADMILDIKTCFQM